MFPYNRKLAAAVVAAVTFFSAFQPVLAAPAKKYSAADAASEFAEVLELLDSTYLYRDNLDYKKLVDDAINAAFGQLDQYSDYMTKEEYDSFMTYGDTNMSGIGVSIVKTGPGYARVTKVYTGSPAEKAGVKPNDIITKINAASVKDKHLTDIRDLLVGAANTSVVVTVERGGEAIPLTIMRGSFSVPLAERIKLSELLPGANDSKTAYVEISSFVYSEVMKSHDTAAQFAKIYDELKKERVKNLIIDLRGNLGGDVAAAIKICEMLVKAGKLFTFQYASQPPDTFLSAKTELDFNVAVLVDEFSASASEVTASAIKESESGIIVGSNTYGKGIGQLTSMAPDGKHMIKLTVTEITTRNGNKINGVGVEPDIYVAPAPQVNAAKIDENSEAANIASLKKALEYLGYLAGADGKGYGEDLKNAVRLFQSDIGLAPNGICGEEVITKINGYVMDKYRAKDVVLEKAYEALTK